MRFEPCWLDDDEAEEHYKEILADNIEHFYVGHSGRSCVWIDTVDETVAGIVHVNNYQPTYHTADLSGIFFDKRAFTRGNIAYIYHWIFVELGVTRLNMATQEHNKAARRINTMMGATLDAILPMYWGDEPMYLYGLLAPTALKQLERFRRNEDARKEDDLVG